MTIIDSTKINVIKEYLKNDKYLCKSYMIIIKMADHYNIDAYKLTAIVKLKCKYLFTKRNNLYSFIGNIFASIWRKVSKFTIDDKYNDISDETLRECLCLTMNHTKLARNKYSHKLMELDSCIEYNKITDILDKYGNI